jgi:phosphate-selective porin
VSLHAVMYPQPFGLQAEWNWGEGPALNDARTAIESQSLQGGYVQAMYEIDRPAGTDIWIPFVRWQNFDGAIKYQANAPQTRVNAWEFGVEWQPDPSVELTMVYQKYNRNDVTRTPYAAFQSDVLRMQLR